MSGRDLVRGLRSEAATAPTKAQRSNGVDLLITAFAMIAVGSLAYFGYATWFAPRSPQPQAAPPTQTAAAADRDMVWTAEDSSRCKAVARAAVDDPMPDEAMLANRSVTEGFAGMATLLECRITTKVARFCDPEEKAALVAMIGDYLGRIDLIDLGLGVQGAPMAVLGEVFGGEISAGSEVYNMQKDATFAFMKVYHEKVAAGLRALAREGIVAPSDFASFMGMGVPTAIADIFNGVSAERQLCA
ncbi:MAG: hypothetical protein JWQ89_3932 [Devosia sp.]|uniref:hypothetical protein n=1 Tax=Devosia sp. TaxID=1871048 RepID=UPI0026101DD0|nr:hypothetical protein [Devosia sp.]MDB5542205.1 hypothetical protein [Devosia sp.]